ncbi:hypothetical protein SPSPH_046990 (plasmid) [Sporomusa sphaeroides DSM 2875]|uniref:Uncharacterized protein n=1 Tax=Sporomusa sphaeroides DSM 2875 TaxID=1337886 RepID=A0A1U7MA27_9FIRM|nr:hypothetical protein SPSPH_46040 [Sporomusa sphaeroides DSM 2875]CVK21654.1 hypothetical protein SSPH_04349 [Sporomusa sphaeroides DSM 2875]
MLQLILEVLLWALKVAYALLTLANKHTPN